MFPVLRTSTSKGACSSLLGEGLEIQRSTADHLEVERGRSRPLNCPRKALAAGDSGKSADDIALSSLELRYKLRRTRKLVKLKARVNHPLVSSPNSATASCNSGVLSRSTSRSLVCTEPYEVGNKLNVKHAVGLENSSRHERLKEIKAILLLLDSLVSEDGGSPGMSFERVTATKHMENFGSPASGHYCSIEAY